MKPEVHVFFVLGIFLALFLPVVFAITGEVITGEATQSNFNVSVSVINGLVINILSPLNTTYISSEGATVFLDLNVSSDSAAQSWWFTLAYAENGTVVNESVPFTPNTTISVLPGSNRLTVYANNSFGTEASRSVVFSVRTQNSPPVLGTIASELFACEGNITAYSFNATDSDGDSLEVDISPKNPFFIFPTDGVAFVESNIISLIFEKEHVGLHEETVSVSDSEYSDYAIVNITVMEINNRPTVETLGAKTVWAYGENRTFYELVNVSDIENGIQSSGNFSFNLTFLNGVVPFFNITSYGVINFSANQSYLGAGNSSVVYNLSLCVTDLALISPHENIGLCGQNGLNQTSCQNFSLTVTAQNRAPSILSSTPTLLNFSASGTENILFTANTTDPDGTSPNAYWYVDNRLIEIDSGSLQNSFSYSFGCGVSGAHNISVDISDGELSDSLIWNVTVGYVNCPASSVDYEIFGYGSAGGVNLCDEKWACGDWISCVNAFDSLNEGDIAGELYREIFDSCSTNGWADSCGYQTRLCYEASACKTVRDKPLERQSCYFVLVPGCHDGIKNCHDGKCEFLVDCGGPCGQCATCSDNIQNQGEEGIDCEGPCPSECVEEQLLMSPGEAINGFLSGKLSKTVYISFIIVIVLLIILVIKIYQIISLKVKRI